MKTEKHCFFPCFLLLIFFKICNANHCAPSSCGNILNISNPFRLISDPQGCRDARYELSCESNSTVIYFPGFGKFNVKSINYVNYTIRLADPAVDQDDCSAIPTIPISHSILSYSNSPYGTTRKTVIIGEVDNRSAITFIKCRDPVSSSAYLDRSPCINGVNSPSDPKIYSYAYLGELSLYDLGENCSIEMISILPIRYSSKNISSYSLVETQREMAFGFDLYWHKFYCGKFNCSEECFSDDNFNIVCLNYSNKPFGVQLFPYPLFG